ncbi:MAG: hypothetical protein AAFY59_08665 [Pseudomonadota bacterium]
MPRTSGRHIHILLGPHNPVRPGILHCHPSYVWGFWYLDPRGVHALSSLRAAEFHPDRIPQDKAGWFFNGVSGYMLRKNVSKFAQKERAEAPLPRARAVVFLQEIERRNSRLYYLDSTEMVTAVAAASGAGPVYVKPHPRQSPAVLQKMEALAARLPNVSLRSNSIHDLIPASDVVISQNSAAGFEALLHKKPVITCGPADYHHATIVAQTERDLAVAVAEAPDRMAGFPFQKYVYWFLQEHMLETSKPEFTTRAWARCTATLSQA